MIDELVKVRVGMTFLIKHPAWTSDGSEICEGLLLGKVMCESQDARPLW